MERGDLKRLIETACYFNKVSVRKYYSLSNKLNIVDTRAIVCNILIKEFKLSKKEVSETMGKCSDTIKSYIKIHEHYNILNHYTKLYDNTLSHFNMNFETENDEHHCKIQKTKYDLMLEGKIERLLNENSYLEYLLEKHRRKIY